MTRSAPVSILRSSTIAVHLERELKLSVDADFRLPHIPGTVLPRRLLISTYYDTNAYDLAHAGITLRHRIERGKRSWQLKIPLGNDRQEVEVADDQAEPPDSLGRLLMAYVGHRKLLPIVTLRVWRTGLLIRHGRVPIAEIALDSVSAEKQGATVRCFREVEIELREGGDKTLRTIEQQMRGAGASDHDGRPKLFRALSLQTPTPAPPPDRTAPMVEHVKWALTQHVGWLLTHDPGTRLGAESESLHQMRVGVRRVRAVLHTARPILLPAWEASLDQELDWLGAVLGAARDLDVQIAYFLEASSGLDARDQTLLEPFLSHLRSQREAAQQLLLTELSSERYLELLRQLRHATQDPALVESSVTIHELAARAFKQLRKAITSLSASPSDSTLHTIRIKTKRARYAAELAKESIGKPASRFIKAARAVQDLLGIHQDAIQAERHVRRFLKSSPSSRAGFVAGRMVERQHQRRQSVRKDLIPLLKTLLKRGKKAWG